jgi:hypothetical protein
MADALTPSVGGAVGGTVAIGGEVGAIRQRDEHGMVSAEWAVGLIAAIAVAGVLLAVVTNGAVKSALLNFILLVIRAFAGGL